MAESWLPIPRRTSLYGRRYPSRGIISPTLLNITLSGLENTIKANFKKQDKINVVVYADDFIITGTAKEVLENRVKPIIERFLEERGLELSQEKTKITHISEGFDFLGVNTRKYRNGKLIQKPTKEGIKRFLKTLKETIHKNQAVSTEILIHLLNPKLTGWANYYRHYCSKETFGTVSHRLFSLLWMWAKKRHNRKGKLWIVKKYFRTKGNNNWQFSTKVSNKKGKVEWLDLVEISHTPIRQHVKLKAMPPHLTLHMRNTSGYGKHAVKPSDYSSRANHNGRPGGN